MRKAAPAAAGLLSFFIFSLFITTRAYFPFPPKGGIGISVGLFVLMAIVFISPNYGLQTLRPYCSPKYFAGLCLTALYAAFCLIGMRTILEPVKASSFPKENYLYFVAAAFWFLLIFLLFITLVEKGALRLTFTPSSVKFRQIFFGLFILFSAIWMLYLIAYNPGIFTYDSFDHWKQIIGVGAFNNRHPIFYTLFIWLGSLPFGSPIGAVILQLLCAALIFSRFLAHLCEDGLRPAMALVFALLIAMLPTTGLHIVSLLKDVPYAITLIWLVDILYRFHSRSEFSKSWQCAVELSFCLALNGLFRQNGLVITLLAGIYFLIQAIRRHSSRIAIGFISSFLIVIAMNTVVLDILHADKSTVGGSQLSIVMINDLIALDRMGCEIPHKAKALIESSLGHMNEIPFSFYYVDGTWRRETPENWINIDRDGRLRPYYIQAIRENPKQMLKIFLLRQELLWSVIEVDDSFTNLVNFTGNPDDNYAIYGLTRIRTKLTGWMDNFIRWTKDSPCYFLLWRTAIYNPFALVLMIVLLVHQKKALWCLAIPFFGNLIALPLITLADYRYVFPNFLLFWCLLMCVMVTINHHSDIENSIVG